MHRLQSGARQIACWTIRRSTYSDEHECVRGTFGASQARRYFSTQARPDVDPYALLHILGLADAVEYRELVERYLEWPNDPMLARLALQILCDYWGETDRYLETVGTFLQGVSWDIDQDVRLLAISSAGEYLRFHSDRNLLLELLQIFENPNEPRLVRESAYCALARAMGLNWTEIPTAARHLDLETEIDSAVVQEARLRLVQER